MKILFVTPFLPYSTAPHAGGAAMYGEIRALSGDHEVHLLSRFEPHEAAQVESIRPYCKQVHLYRFHTPRSRNPFVIALSYCILGWKANALMRTMRYDLLLVHYTETGLTIRKSGIPGILVAHDVITKPALRRHFNERGFLSRTAARLRYLLVRAVEKYISLKFSRVLVMGPQDKQALHDIDKRIQVEISPIMNGLHFNTDTSASGREPCSLLYWGAMHRPENVQAALYLYEKIMPLVRRNRSDIRLYIVGNNPPPEILSIAQADPAVTVTGYVAEPADYFNKATVCVTPLFVGGGIIIKNLMAMSFGLPVVTTAIGNEGIGAVSERDVLIAETPEDFAEKILFLLSHSAEARLLGENGKKFARDHFSDSRLLQQRLSIMNDVVSRNR